MDGRLPVHPFQLLALLLTTKLRFGLSWLRCGAGSAVELAQLWSWLRCGAGSGTGQRGLMGKQAAYSSLNPAHIPEPRLSWAHAMGLNRVRILH